MKKLVLSALVIILVSMSSFAQIDKKFYFSAGGELGTAVGSFNNSHSVGIGGSIQAEYFVMDKLKATATWGFHVYAGKRSLSSNPDKAAQRIMPLRIGGKYYLTGGLYGAAQLGVAFLRNFEPHSGTAFAYSPLMVGYEFKLKSEKAFDATVKYDAYTGSGGTVGTFGLRVAYVF